MSEIVFPKKDVETLRDLVRSMLSTLRGYWTHAESYQKFLYFISAILIVSGIFHLGVIIATGGSWEGPVSWRKPIVFGFSGGVSCLSIAWIMTFLPKRRVGGWLLSGILGISMLVEVSLVTMQRWRGVPSHFNFSTTFDATVFTAMGTLIIFVGIVIVVVMFWSFFSLKTSPSMAWAIRVGLIVLVISQVFGNLIIQNGIPKVMDFETGEFISEGLSSTNIFGSSGLMKLPHSLSLHAVQVLPVLAWLLIFTNWSEGQRTRTVMVAIAGYSGLVMASAFQTFSGLAPFEMQLLVVLVIGVSSIGVLGAYIAALTGLRRSLGQTAISSAASNDKEEAS